MKYSNENSTFAIIDPEVLIALERLHNASTYIRDQWLVTMKRDEAKSNLDARALIFNCCNLIFREHGCGITKEEAEARNNIRNKEWFQ